MNILQLGLHFSELHELEGLLQKIESDVVPANTAQLLRHIELAELLLAEMQMNGNQLTGESLTHSFVTNSILCVCTSPQLDQFLNSQ